MAFQVCPSCKVYHSTRTERCDSCGYCETGSSSNGRTTGWQSVNAGSIPADSTNALKAYMVTRLFRNQEKSVRF